MAYALITYSDGSKALCHSTPAKVRRENETGWMTNGKPHARLLTKREALEVYRTADLAVIGSSIIAEFDPEAAD